MTMTSPTGTRPGTPASHSPSTTPTFLPHKPQAVRTDQIAEMQEKQVICTAVEEERWGSITRITLPGGGKLGVYQPKHVSPLTH